MTDGAPAGELDVAILGAGAAGTYVAHRLSRARPDWRVTIFERTDRVGGRLRSVAVPGIDHPIELGGMRYVTSHHHVTSLVAELGLPTHPFDQVGGTERSFLRGRFADGPTDPAGGSPYALTQSERGRSAADLTLEAFLRIVPNATSLSPAEFQAIRANGRYLDRRITDWSIGEVYATVRSEDGKAYVRDAFGYDSGSRVFNAGDVIEFMLGGGHPNAEARTPDAGMDSIPRELARQFVDGGGDIRLDHEITSIAVEDGGQRLTFADGVSVRAARTVVAIPVPALRLLAAETPALRTPLCERIFGAVEGFPATKLYVWYNRPWWRPGVPGIRMTTDLPPRKLFYLDTDAAGPAAMIASYTDGLHVAPWRDLWDGAPAGAPASSRMLDAVRGFLRMLHPDVSDIPEPVGSSFMYWGADPHEIGWHFWAAGANSDETMAQAIQPDPAVAIYLAGEAFSRSQSWVEGALETADVVVGRLLSQATD